MEIPYVVQPREDTGLFNAKVGIWLFLASEVMLFGALFSAYVLIRVGSSNWLYGSAKDLNVPIGTTNTAVLITSSITMVMAWASLKLKQFNKFRIYQTLTILLGLTFLLIKSYEYSEKFHHGHYPSVHDFFALYFVLTGLHALHVFAGMVVNGYHLFTSRRWWQRDPERFTNRVEVAGLFWHFVDLVWIFLFPVLYLL